MLITPKSYNMSYDNLFVRRGILLWETVGKSFRIAMEKASPNEI